MRKLKLDAVTCDVFFFLNDNDNDKKIMIKKGK